MVLYNDDDEESNADFISRLDALGAQPQPNVVNADDEPLSIDQVVSPSIEAPALPKPGQTQILPGLKSDLVRQYIANKRQQQDQDNERANLVKGVQDTDSSILGNIFAGLSGLGAGIKGGDVGSAFNTAKNLQLSVPNRALNEFDKAKQLELEKQDRELKRNAEDRAIQKDLREGQKFQMEQAKFREDNDPNSSKSQAYRQFLVKSLKIEDPDMLAGLAGKSYSDLEKTTPILTKAFDQSWEKQKHDEDKAQQASQFATTDQRVRSEGALNRASRERAAAAMGGQRGFNNDIALLNASRMPPDVRKQVIDTVDVKKSYQNLYDQYQNDPNMIGFLNGTINAQKFFGTETGKKLLADENILFDKERLKSTGAAFSPQELDALASHKIKPTDTPTEFKAKLAANMGTLNRALGTLNEFGGSQGYDMSYLNPYLDKPSTSPARALPSNPNRPNKTSENTDPSKGPTARFPIGSIATNKKTGKPQVMTATGFRDQ